MIQHFCQVSHNSGFGPLGSLGNVVDLTHQLSSLEVYGSDLRGDTYSDTDTLSAHRVLGGGEGGRRGGGEGVLSLPGAEHTRGMSRVESAQVMKSV